MLRIADKRPDRGRPSSLAHELEVPVATAQAASAGISVPRLRHHLRTERVLRRRVGVYRLARDQAGGREDLGVAVGSASLPVVRVVPAASVR